MDKRIGGGCIVAYGGGYEKSSAYYFDGLCRKGGWAVVAQSGSGRGSNQVKIVFVSERISSLKNENAVTLENFL